MVANPNDLVDSENQREIQLRAASARSMKAESRADTSSYPDPLLTPSIYGLRQIYAPLAYLLPFAILDLVEMLAKFNPDYSQAVENIKTLSNPGFELIVDDSPRNSKNLKALLEDMSRTVQERNGGIDGLIDKLMGQAATYGAMCGEWQLSEDLTDVVDFVDVNPKHIRFFYEDDKRWHPYQRVSFMQVEDAKARGQKTVQNFVKLNEFTFHYYAFDAAPGIPYGTPPFIAAIANIAIQKDMVFNMSQIVKKVGLLGLIDMTVKALPNKAGETNEQFQSRATAYLQRYADAVEQMVRDGGIIHFDDATITATNIAGNAAGATNIFKQNEELVFSGLKSMPSVQGRSYCVVPETRVLTADLRWVQAGDLFLDDELVGFDEDLGKLRGSGAVARMKRSFVERNERIKLPCVRVTTDKGEITVSEQHPMVVLASRQIGRGWRDAADLKSGDKLIWFGEPWEVDRSYDAGYLAGIFDGEGTLGRSGSGKNGTVTMAQRSGDVLDETVMAMKRLGFEPSVGPPIGGTNKDVCMIRLLGGKSETLRFLGQVRPHRLLAKAPMTWEGASLRNGGSINQTGRKDVYATVLKVEPAGIQEVVALQTSSRTFISEGLLSHNSTTETYAGVAYDIIIRNTEKYQRAAKRMIEGGYWLKASLQGFTPDSISMKFKSNKSLHRLQDAQAEQAEIINTFMLWISGLIDQQDAAQRQGYSEPKTLIDEPSWLPAILRPLVSERITETENLDANGNPIPAETGDGSSGQQ